MKRTSPITPAGLAWLATCTLDRHLTILNHTIYSFPYPCGTPSLSSLVANAIRAESLHIQGAGNRTLASPFESFGSEQEETGISRVVESVAGKRIDQHDIR